MCDMEGLTSVQAQLLHRAQQVAVVDLQQAGYEGHQGCSRCPHQGYFPHEAEPAWVSTSAILKGSIMRGPCERFGVKGRSDDKRGHVQCHSILKIQVKIHKRTETAAHS